MLELLAMLVVVKKEEKTSFFENECDVGKKYHWERILGCLRVESLIRFFVEVTNGFLQVKYWKALPQGSS